MRENEANGCSKRVMHREVFKGFVARTNVRQFETKKLEFAPIEPKTYENKEKCE